MHAISESFSAKTGEISAADLLGELDGQRGKRLVFNYEGHDVSPGYHVTEVKNGSVSGAGLRRQFRKLVRDLHPALGYSTGG